jgi:hypothetical protein
MGDQHGDRAGCQAGPFSIGAAGQNDRYTRPHDHTGGIGIGHEGQLLGQHIAGFQVRYDQDVGPTGHR